MAQLRYWDGAAWVDAVVGVQGPIGSQGIVGSQGTQGTQGTLGTTGSQGTQGTQGTIGSQGSQGTQGTQGTQGLQGLTGSGSQGTQGTVGSQGSQGTQGLLGLGYSGVTSTTSFTVSTGSKVFAAANTGAFVVGQYVRVINTGTPANFMVGTITALTTNTSITVNVLSIGGSGTFTAWTFSLEGLQGTQGTQGTAGSQGTQGTQGLLGLNYSGVTSATSFTISTGSKAFTTTNTGAFVIGQYVRVINTGTPANFMIGTITALTANTSITVNVTSIGGSGTFTAWTFSLEGLQGTQGTLGTGSQGTQGTQGLGGTAPNTLITAPLETVTVTGTSATGTLQFDVITQSVLYYNGAATANFVINFRGNAGTTLNALMATGQAVTCTLLSQNGATAYYPTSITIDGTTNTPRWQNGVPAVNGNPNAIDAYSYTIIKTAASTYTVLATQVKFVA